MAILMTEAEFRTHEGFMDDPPTNAQITDLIAEWQGWIERATGQFFDSRVLEFSKDGVGNGLILFPVPIIEIEFIKVDDGDTTLLADDYRVYSGRQTPNDDRNNPKIKLKMERLNIFRGQYAPADTPYYQRTVFQKGEQNIVIKGTFGFTEPDGSPPLLILKAIRRLVLRDSLRIKDGGYPSGGGGSSGGGAAGTIVEEWTDSHKYKLANIVAPPSTWSSSGDAEVDRIVGMYRRATKIGATSNWW